MSHYSFSFWYMTVIVPLSITVPLSIGVRKYSILQPALKTFVWYLVLSAAGNATAAFLASRRINNLPLLHVYTLLELMLISAFYQRLLPGSRALPLIRWATALFAVFCVLNAIFLQPLHTYNSYARSLSGLMVILLSLYYFKHCLDGLPEQVAQQQAALRINAGLLLYFGGALFLFVSANLILRNLYMNTLFWNIHASFVLIMYIFAAIGLRHAKR